MWINLGSSGSPEWGRDWFTLLCKGKNWDTAAYCLLVSANTTRKTVEFLINSHVACYAGTNAILHKWYHIAATFNGSLARIYLDGNLIGSSPFLDRIMSNPDDLLIGNEYKSVYPFNGMISSVRIFNSALNDQEIKELSKSLFVGSFPILHLDFENLYLFLERSEDGVNFYPVLNQSINQINFSWKENKVGQYSYRVSIFTKDGIKLSNSNPMVVSIIPREILFNSNSILSFTMFLSTVIIYLYGSYRQRARHIDAE